MEKVIGKVKCYTLHCVICTLRNYTIICFYCFRFWMEKVKLICWIWTLTIIYVYFFVVVVEYFIKISQNFVIPPFFVLWNEKIAFLSYRYWDSEAWVCQSSWTRWGSWRRPQPRSSGLEVYFPIPSRISQSRNTPPLKLKKNVILEILKKWHSQSSYEIIVQFSWEVLTTILT